MVDRNDFLSNLEKWTRNGNTRQSRFTPDNDTSDLAEIEADKKEFVVQQLRKLAELCSQEDNANISKEKQKVFENLNANREYLKELGIASFADFSRLYAPHLDHHKRQNLRFNIDFYVVNHSGRIPPATIERNKKDKSYIFLSEVYQEIEGLQLSEGHKNLFAEALSKSQPVHKESLVRLARTLQAARQSGKTLLAGLYHTTTGRSLPGMLQDKALVSGDQLMVRGREVLAGEGIRMIDKNGNPLFKNPNQVSFASYVERRYATIDWFMAQDQLISIGVNQHVDEANGSLGAQYNSPYALTEGNWHSIVCDPELFEAAEFFVYQFGFQQPPLILTSTEYELYYQLSNRKHPFGYFLSQDEKDMLIIKLGNTL